MRGFEDGTVGGIKLSNVMWMHNGVGAAGCYNASRSDAARADCASVLARSERVAERRPFSPDDFWAMRFITDMRLAPDGQRLAYVVESADRMANETRAAIWLYDTETDETRQLTSGTKRDTAPRWSPDGHTIAFLSTRDGKAAQVWAIAAGGGEAQRLTSMRHGASAPFWAADGSWVGYLAEVREGESPFEPEAERAVERQRREREEAQRPRTFTRLVYRWDGSGYFEGRTHIFRVPAAGGAVEQVTHGDYDHEEAVCSPDGVWLAFVSDRSERRDANMASDLWLLHLAAGGLRRLTDEHHTVSHLAWSPDGTRIACFYQPEVAEHSIYNTALAVATIASGEIVNVLDPRVDVSAEVALSSDLPSPKQSAPVWSADGQDIYTLGQQGGGVDVLRVRAHPGGERRIGERLFESDDRHIMQINVSPDGSRLYALQALPDTPWEIRAFDLPDPREMNRSRNLTHSTSELLADRATFWPERLRIFCEGRSIDAWLYRPPQTPEAGAPMVLWIHGGPHGTYGQSFYLQAQILAARGYAVLQVNPRGSAGYGEAFMQACDRDWGGGDNRDLMAVVDAAIAGGGINGERLAVMGVSYGGYMTNWIVGQTERFRAAVSINGICNLYSMFGTADMDPVWAQGDYGWPWEREAFYRERSPLTYAERVTTPIRIIGAEEDYRCPIGQSEEWFTWLKKYGKVPVELVRFPKASHVVFASPRQRIRRMELVLEWIERYCPVSGAADEGPR